MKFRTTLILLAIACGLAVYLVVTHRPPAEVRKEEAKMVLSIRGEEVVRKLRLVGTHGVIKGGLIGYHQ